MAETVSTNRITDYSKLTREEEAKILSLDAGGLTQVQIALQIGCSQGTVSKVLKELRDPILSAANILRDAQPELAKRLVKEAKPDHILEVFDRTGVARKTQGDSGKTAIQIIVGTPGSPAGHDPVIQVNGITNYQTQIASESETGQ